MEKITLKNYFVLNIHLPYDPEILFLLFSQEK